MTGKVYSVRSNARRDARKQGLDPNSVVACVGGFVIGKPKPSRTGGDAKGQILSEMLSAGWQRMDRLEAALGWQAHTIRGAISTLAKKRGLKAERRREAGITSYRLMAAE